MSHQPLDDQQVGALLQVVRGKTVPEGMRGVRFFDVGRLVACFFANFAHGRYTKVGAFSPGAFKC